MTESKSIKPEIPHKPAPKSVARRPLSTDYRADPANPYPLIAPAPKVAQPTEPAGELKAAKRSKSPKLLKFSDTPKSARQSVWDAFATVSRAVRRSDQPSAQWSGQPSGQREPVPQELD